MSKLCHFLDHVIDTIDDQRVVMTEMSKKKSLWHVLWYSLSAVLILPCCERHINVLEVLLFVRCGEVMHVSAAMTN